MRLFFALWPPREAARALAAWAGEVAARTAGKAMRESRIHLTLAFLGEADPGQASAAAAAAHGRRCTLPIDIARYWKHNRIVWVGPAILPQDLSRLVTTLHGVLKGGGFALEERPFAAHVTLVRNARAGAPLPALPEVDWPVDEFVLLRSVPAAGGSRYDVIERFPLA